MIDEAQRWKDGLYVVVQNAERYWKVQQKLKMHPLS